MDMNGKITVFVIYNKNQYTKDAIVDIIKEEGYPHYFFFSENGVSNDIVHLEVADEVWTFGNVENKASFIVAQNQGKDIWVMG